MCFATKIEKIAMKIDKFCKLSVLIGELCIVCGGPEYYIHPKGTQ